MLSLCYRHSLEAAQAHPIRSIAFPSISTGIYGYPVREAARVAVETVRACISEGSALEKVVFCCFSPEGLAIYGKLLQPG